MRHKHKQFWMKTAKISMKLTVNHEPDVWSGKNERFDKSDSYNIYGFGKQQLDRNQPNKESVKTFADLFTKTCLFV